MTMPTIFDVKVQAEEGDYFEPTAADYEGDPDRTDFCQNCGLVKDASPSPMCDDCDEALYQEMMNDLYAQLLPYAN